MGGRKGGFLLRKEGGENRDENEKERDEKENVQEGSWEGKKGVRAN